MATVTDVDMLKGGSRGMVETQVHKACTNVKQPHFEVLEHICCMGKDGD